MANFNPNRWYHVFPNQDPKTGLVGTSLFKDKVAGSVFYSGANVTRREQQWQFYPIDSEYYVLRTSEGGPEGFLGATISANETSPGHTRARMTRGNVLDDSVYWKIEPWKDGTFFMWNKRNESSWHLGKNASTVFMDSNITAPRNGQRLSFSAIKEINAKQFSTVNLNSAAVTTPSPQTITDNSPITSTPNSNTNTNTNTPLPSNAPSAPTSTGLSTTTKAAIGVSIIIALLIGSVVLGLFLWQKRKRRQRRITSKELDGVTAYPDIRKGAHVYEMNHDATAKYEMPSHGVYAELPPNYPPVELPGSPIHRAR
ncbi:hypothetical protein CC80DRAFT_436314 [Byssothecium circinans]|uniref:Ricin B lectin domain-containing protein n=1 Tax=Byssothecium circinans TaxID=147558 RepID=A0A6A5U9Q3_9PLEO|nr:hypothetical protein CC80DRAFT_436314 [Byssothecium circinans]